MNIKHILTIVSLALCGPAWSQTEAPPPLVPFATIRADATGQKLQEAMIWTGAVPTNKTGVAVAFRRTFDLPAVPREAVLHLFADARYVLWVNGAYVERGPNRFQPNGPEYDSVKVTSHLRPGKNVIAILALGNLSGGKVMRHAPGLTALLETDGREILRTDPGWRFRVATWYRNFGASLANIEDWHVDAREEDGDWTGTDYAEAGWKPAVPADGRQWGALTARRIPMLREQEVAVHFDQGIKLPLKLVPGQKVFFRTERLVQAYAVVELEAEAGSRLELEPFSMAYIARAGAQKYVTLDTRGLAYNFAAITLTSGQATLTGIRLIERIYPFDRVGSFTCNDPALNKLWALCARSCEVLSEDAYVDCADRERVEWMDCDPPAFDVTRTALAGPGSNGKPLWADPRLLGEMVRRTALTVQPEGWVKAHTCSDRYDVHAKMEDRACEWVTGLRRYFDATGDAALVREVWPAVVAQLNYFLDRRTPRGLVCAREWVVWGNPVGYVTLEGAGLNAFVYRALADAAFLGGKIGEPKQAGTYDQAAQQLAAAFNQVLWNEKEGTFYSGYYDESDPASAKRKPGLKIENHLVAPSAYAAIFALERGIASPAHRAPTMKYLLEHREPKGLMMIYYYIYRLLYATGPDYDREILQAFRDKWSAMREAPAQCTWEFFSGGSLAHVYGMYPGYFLSAYVLGVRRDAPVAERQLIIEPHLGDLTQAEGTVVTEYGPVPVSWRCRDGELQFRFATPRDVQTILRIPDGEASTLRINGKQTRTKIQGRYVSLPVRPGTCEGKIVLKPQAQGQPRKQIP